MKEVTLEILASDIKETEYTNSKDCAITRALARAGYPELEDQGLVIANKDSWEYVIKRDNKKYAELSVKVADMYMGRREIEDFTHVLELNI